MKQSSQVADHGATTPKVSVIISHFNSARTIGECLRSLSKQEYPHSLYEIVVVDAGSTDGSAEIVDKMNLPNVRQIVVPGCSEPEGHIIGIETSDGEILMFTNSDVYVPRGWIRSHLKWLNSGYDLVGGRVFWGGDKFTFVWNMPAHKKNSSTSNSRARALDFQIALSEDLSSL